MSDTESSLDIIEKGPLPDEVAVEPEEQAATEQPDAEEAEATEEAQEEQEESEAEAEEEPKPKRRRNRTAKLAAKLTNAEQQIASLQQQLQRLQPTEPVDEVQPPKQEDFATYEEFVRADARFVAKQEAAQAVKGLTQQVQNATQQVEARHVEAEWNKRETKAAEKYDDYFEVVRDEDLQITQNMADAIRQMDDGTDVAYHLGTHPDESARIAQLTPVGQVIELGRIASKLARPKPKSTAAPPPVKTVKSASAPQGLTPATAKTMEDYIKARQPKEAGSQK